MDTENKYPVTKEYLKEQIKNYDEYRKLDRQGKPNGIATLNIYGKLENDQIPTSSLFVFLGSVTALPESANKNEVVLYNSNYYVWNGNEWKKGFATDTITSVNGETGDVVIDGDTLTIDFNNIRQSIASAISQAIDIAVPIGTVQSFLGAEDAEPNSRWLFCDGKEYNIKDYPKLAKLLGFTTGDTFKVPDLTGRFLQCTNELTQVGSLTEAGLPNIKGAIWWNNIWRGGGSAGAFSMNTTAMGGYVGSGTDTYAQYWLDAESGRKYWHKEQTGEYPDDSIYGNSKTVQPPAIQTRFIIRAR